MIRALLIEDEALAASKLRRLLQKVAPEVQIIDQLDTVVKSINYLNKYQDQLDLLFLDIHLADSSSFEILEAIEIKVPIIFTTAFDQYTLQAFKAYSIDYLLKPIEENALRKSIQKFKAFYHQTKAADQYKGLLNTFLAQHQTKQRFLVQVGNKIRSIQTKEIALFYAANKANFLLTFTGKRYDINYKIDQLVQMIPGDFFFKASRKCIVHIDSIQEAYQFSRSRLKLELLPKPDFDVFVPSEKITNFKQWLNR